MLFSGKIYTAKNIFTRPPVATNFKSVMVMMMMMMMMMTEKAGLGVLVLDMQSAAGASV